MGDSHLQGMPHDTLCAIIATIPRLDHQMLSLAVQNQDEHLGMRLINGSATISIILQNKTHALNRLIVFCVGASKAPPALYFVIQHRKAVPLFLAIPFMHLRIQ